MKTAAGRLAVARARELLAPIVSDVFTDALSQERNTGIVGGWFAFAVEVLVRGCALRDDVARDVLIEALKPSHDESPPHLVYIADRGITIQQPKSPTPPCCGETFSRIARDVMSGRNVHMSPGELLTETSSEAIAKVESTMGDPWERVLRERFASSREVRTEEIEGLLDASMKANDVAPRVRTIMTKLGFKKERRYIDGQERRVWVRYAAPEAVVT